MNEIVFLLFSISDRLYQNQNVLVKVPYLVRIASKLVDLTSTKAQEKQRDTGEILCVLILYNMLLKT